MEEVTQSAEDNFTAKLDDLLAPILKEYAISDTNPEWDNYGKADSMANQLFKDLETMELPETYDTPEAEAAARESYISYVASKIRNRPSKSGSPK